MGFIEKIKKTGRIFINRLRTQGILTTLIWFYGRGIPYLTGVPLERYSRITPNIYLGAQYGPVGKRKLEQLGITGSVNMRIEFDSAEHGLALNQHCHLPTIDDDAPTLEHLEKGIDFIQQVIDEGGKVYIHCAGGIGRAPTMTVAYLISQGHTLAEAIALVKKYRPFINIMPPQMEQLKRFEALQLERNGSQ
jgi:dual specificity MAP kinase phosphatase